MGKALQQEEASAPSRLGENKARAAFLDRDGVINQKAPDGQYVTSWEDFHFLPDVKEALGRLRQAGFSIIIVTNQRCVAKGLLTESELKEIHGRMSEELAGSGAAIDAIYYCPHELEPACSCRKPAPGMLLDAARSRSLDLAASWMIGDSDIDIQAGKNAGCRTAWLSASNYRTGEPRQELVASSEADVIAPSLLEAISQILRFGDREKEPKT